MPSKSRHRKGKYQLPSKKKKGRRSPPAIVSQKKAAPRVEVPVATVPEVAATSPRIPAPAVVKNPELVVELRKIGILAGVMLAALVILVLALD